MSWNEIKVHLVPIGSKVFERKDHTALTADGYPVAILSVQPPESASDKLVKADDMVKWLLARSFQARVQKPQSTRFRFQDIEVLTHQKDDFVKQITLNLEVSADVRSRLGIWQQFIKELCDNHHLRLIDSEVGLVGPEAFEGLAKRSFAWECLLEIENNRKQGA